MLVPYVLGVQGDAFRGGEYQAIILPFSASPLCEELRGAGLGCEVREDEVTILWSKLCFLAPFALATAASGGPRGVVCSDPSWWARLEGCVKEACAVGVAEGAKVAPEPILAAFQGAPESFRSSMLSRGPSCVAALSTASRCQRPGTSWIVALE